MAPVTIHRVEGTIVIGIKTAHGLDGQLVPSYGKAEVGRGLGTHKDRGKPIDQANRRWRPIKVDGGWHVRYDKEPTLFLGLSADEKAPTLTTTPALWAIPGLDGDKDAAIAALKEELAQAKAKSAQIAALKAKDAAAKDAEIAELKAEIAALNAAVAARDAAAQAAIKSLIGA
jgi:hypothetical protein